MSELPPRKRRKKKRPGGTTPQERSAQRDESVEPTASDSKRDRLGKLLEKHEVTLGGLIVVCTILLLIGGAVFVWGYLQEPRTRTSLTIMIVGGFIGLMGLILFGINLLNVGRCLELRKRGIRFRERGSTTELLWSEIAHVEVERLDATNLGVATKYSKGNDAAAVSGPLTKTEFTVKLHSDTGETILLPSGFLRTVADPKKLISSLKLRSGV